MILKFYDEKIGEMIARIEKNVKLKGQKFSVLIFLIKNIFNRNI